MINKLTADEYTELSARFDQFVQDHLPLGSAMGLKVNHYNGDSISLLAPLELNDNDKGTAFGGSLYCAAVMAGWGYFYLRCLQYNLTEELPSIVISKAEIEYLAPVNSSNIIASCSNNDASMWDEFLNTYKARGRAKVTLSCLINADGATASSTASSTGEESPAVKFTGTYALIN